MCDHDEITTAFENAFEVELAEYSDGPDLLIHRYWIERDNRAPVKATLVYRRAEHKLQ